MIRTNYFLQYFIKFRFYFLIVSIRNNIFSLCAGENNTDDILIIKYGDVDNLGFSIP